MKQLGLFDCSNFSHNTDEDAATWQLFVDGASRNNPGQSGAGVYLLKNDKVVVAKGFDLGIKTNNEAEYLALLLGVFLAREKLYSNDIFYIVSDSQLMIRQLKREYKVKMPHLQKLHAAAFTLLEGLNYSFCHVLREHNTHADALANKGADKKGTAIPSGFIEMLRSHQITV